MIPIGSRESYELAGLGRGAAAIKVRRLPRRIVFVIVWMMLAPAVASGQKPASVVPSPRASVPTAAEGLATATGVAGNTVDISSSAAAFGRVTGTAAWTPSMRNTLGTFGAVLTATGLAAKGVEGYYRDGVTGVITSVGNDVAEMALCSAFVNPLLSASCSGGVAVGNALIAGTEIGAKAFGVDLDIKGSVTDYWYDNTLGIRDRRDFEAATSQAAIDAHRERLRQQFGADLQQNQTEVIAAPAPSPGTALSPQSYEASAFRPDEFRSLLDSAIAIQDALARTKPTTSCSKIYKTPDGCHPGHDEKAHPGGCRC